MAGDFVRAARMQPGSTGSAGMNCNYFSGGSGGGSGMDGGGVDDPSAGAATSERALDAVKAAARASGMDRASPVSTSSGSAARAGTGAGTHYAAPPQGLAASSGKDSVRHWGEARGGLGPGEDSTGDVVEGLLPHACGLLRGVGGG